METLLLPEQTTFFEEQCIQLRKALSSLKSDRVSKVPENLFEKRAKDMLKCSTKVKIVSVNAETDSIEVVVEIENNAGHKFPTGFPSRRAVVHFVVEDKNSIFLNPGKFWTTVR